MDFTPVIAPLQLPLSYLLPLLLIAMVIKTPWFKGMIGEWFINLGIRLFLDKQEYHLLKGVTLHTPQGTTQIDHVIVSRFGLFVIETKNMKGWIFGNPAHKSWTQQIYRRKHSFQNPLRQNHLHVMTLKTLLGLSDHQLHSIIFFIGDCTFKTPMPDNVMNRGLIRHIKGKTTQVFGAGRRCQGGRDHPARTTGRQLADQQTTRGPAEGASWPITTQTVIRSSRA